MATTIVTKSGSGAPTASDLVAGELAVDLTNKRLYTEDSGGTVLELGTNPSGNVTFGDNGKAIFGAGNDLQIYHDGSNSWVKDSGDGVLALASNGNGVGLYNADGTKPMVFGTVDSDVKIYHNGLLKLATTATGIDVTGSVTADVPTGGGLLINSADIATIKMKFSGGSTTNWGFATNNSAAGDFGIYASNSAGGDPITAGTAKIYINSAGNAGIGTISPNSAGLGANGQTLQLGARTFIATDSSGDTRLGGLSGSNITAFYQGGTERMRISGAEVYVGHTGATAPWAMTGSAFGINLMGSGGFIGAARSGAEPLLLNRTSSDGAIINLRKDGATVGSIGNIEDLLYIAADDTTDCGIRFDGDNQEISPCTATGAYSDGNIDLGDGSARFKDLHLSGVSYNGDGSAAAPSISFGADTNTGFYRVGSDQIGFVTAGTIKAKLDASGNLLVGTSSVNGVDGTTFSSTGNATHNTSNTSSFECLTFRVNGTQVGSIVASSGSSTIYNTSSDQRLKENIADADDAGSKIDAIQVRKYDWKADGSHQDYGMVAQELLEVAPEAVHQPEDPEEMMGVDYSKLVPMMLKEIQSLRARIAALES